MSNLRKVAKRAGVSSATVSRVFSRPDMVSEDTKARVMRAAEELDWRPSQTARSLALGRTGNIALVVPDMSNPIFGDALKAAHAFVRSRGFSIFSVHSDGSTESEREVVSAIAEKADGIVLISPRMSQTHVQQLRRIRPVALVNRSFPGIPSTIVPSADGMTRLVEHLAARGHTHVAYLAGPSFSIVNKYRLDAFLSTTASLHVRGTVLGEIKRDYLAMGAMAVDEIVATGATAVIGYNDMVAVGLLGELHRRGGSPRGGLAAAGFDGSWLCEATTPSLTSVSIPFAQAIEWAITDVISAIDGKPQYETRELASTLVVRESTANPVVPDERPAS